MNPEYFSALESCISGAFFSVNINSKKITHLSDQVWAVTGYSSEDLKKLDFEKIKELIHKDDINKIFSEINHIIKNKLEESVKVTFRLLTQEESWVWLEASIKSNGEHLFGYIQDVSENKGLELGYMNQSSHLMTLMNAIPGYVSWLKSDLTYIGVNESLSTVSGVTHEAFIGKPYGFLSLNVDEKTENKTKLWLKKFSDNKSEKSTQTETQIIGPFGTRHFLLSAAKYGDQDNIVLIGIDHTKLKELEKEVETEKARNIHQARMAALGEMASGIAHEINNPLQIIISVGDEIAKNPLFKKPGEMLVRAGDRIAKIVKGLKTFSRDGEQDPIETVLISNVLKETIDFAQVNFKKKDVLLTIEPYDETIDVECRSVQISQVIMNLFNNAIDAIEGLSEKWVKVSVKDLGRDIEIAVTDSGPGIPPEIAEKIMNPFFTTKSAGKGTGLGLSISTGILKAHHGVVGLDETSKNTRFYIRWPKLQPNSTSQKSYRD
ncbi:MAG: PAS domain-containing sensor histidine kinase [Xanthomonadaceae bacterium]|nr:PAS domain-containing sensor histidine kinase [Xanthomonadaceae bacterium]